MCIICRIWLFSASIIIETRWVSVNTSHIHTVQPYIIVIMKCVNLAMKLSYIINETLIYVPECSLKLRKTVGVLSTSLSTELLWNTELLILFTECITISMVKIHQVWRALLNWVHMLALSLQTVVIPVIWQLILDYVY